MKENYKKKYIYIYINMSVDIDMRVKFAECVKDKMSGPAREVLKTFYDVIESGLRRKEEIINALEASRSKVEKKKHLARAIEMLRLEYVPEEIVDENGKMQDLISEPSRHQVKKLRACKLYNYMKDCINQLSGGGRKRKNKYRRKKTKKISKKRISKKRKSKKRRSKKYTKRKK
jgi:hypothetical protein